MGDGFPTELVRLLEGGWWDVSRPIGPETPVWPGDVAVEVHTRREPWGVLSSFSSTCHAATHAEAPRHVAPAAPGLDGFDLERYIGLAEVVRVELQGGLVLPACLHEGWCPRAPRVLFRTDTHPRGEPIAAGFAALHPQTAQWLAARGVVLVGIDTPSVDPFDSKELPAHHALHDHGLAWIEGLDLSGVADGLYLMVGLPLPLVDVEAAPMRVVIKPLG